MVKTITGLDLLLTIGFNPVSYTHLDVYKRQEPLFDWLKKEKSGPLGARIEWNFAKFLINREGQVVERFSSKTEPLKMEETIKALLSN